MKKEAGFTLIEVIASLIIIGIITVFAGMAIVTGVKGYVFARDNTSISQKAQLTMTRMSRELMELTNITDVDQSMPNAMPNVTYERLDGSSMIRQTIYLDSSDSSNKIIKIAAGASASGGDELVDGVGSFTLTYYKGTNNWVAGTDDIQLLSAIKIDLDLTRSDGSGDVAFSTTINPRNTGSSGNDFY